MEADDLDKESSSGVACKEKSGKNDLNTEWEWVNGKNEYR